MKLPEIKTYVVYHDKDYVLYGKNLWSEDHYYMVQPNLNTVQPDIKYECWKGNKIPVINPSVDRDIDPNAARNFCDYLKSLPLEDIPENIIKQYLAIMMYRMLLGISDCCNRNVLVVGQILYSVDENVINKKEMDVLFPENATKKGPHFFERPSNSKARASNSKARASNSKAKASNSKARASNSRIYSPWVYAVSGEFMATLGKWFVCHKEYCLELLDGWKEKLRGDYSDLLERLSQMRQKIKEEM